MNNYKFGDIMKTILIILIFAILFLAGIFSRSLQETKDKWPELRCSPMYMGLAGYLGYDTMENFSFSVFLSCF